MPERIKEQAETWVRSIQLPEETDSYKPVSHGSLIATLESKLLEKGLIPTQKRYSTAKGGQELFGMWALGDRDSMQVGDQQLAINFVNSYNKHLKLSLIPGLLTKICSNGAMSRMAIATFDRKHTGSINEEFPIFIESSLEGMHTLYEKMLSDFAKLKEVSLNKKLMSELAGRLFIKEDLITAEQVSLLKREIEKPTFDQFIPENAYSFYQHCTWSIRKSSPSEVIDRYTGIHEFITHEFAL
jgi:hypothetical protein